MTKQPQVEIQNHGSIFAFIPRTKKARAWLQANVASESWQWLGGSLCIEHRSAYGLYQALEEAGFKCI